MLLGRCDRDWCEARRIADRVSLRSPATWPPSVSQKVVGGVRTSSPPEFYHRGHLPPVTVGVLELGDG